MSFLVGSNNRWGHDPWFTWFFVPRKPSDLFKDCEERSSLVCPALCQAEQEAKGLAGDGAERDFGWKAYIGRINMSSGRGNMQGKSICFPLLFAFWL